MKVSDIPYEYICKQKGDNCLCSPEQKKKCPSCKRIVDEEELIKIINKENGKELIKKMKKNYEPININRFL